MRRVGTHLYSDAVNGSLWSWPSPGSRTSGRAAQLWSDLLRICLGAPPGGAPDPVPEGNRRARHDWAPPLQARACAMQPTTALTCSQSPRAACIRGACRRPSKFNGNLGRERPCQGAGSGAALPVGGSGYSQLCVSPSRLLPASRQRRAGRSRSWGLRQRPQSAPAHGPPGRAGQGCRERQESRRPGPIPSWPVWDFGKATWPL